MTTDTEHLLLARSALIDALREAAEAATDDWTHVTLCSNGVYLRAARRWRPDCIRCGQPVRTGNVGPLTWYDRGNLSASQRHGCGAWNSPTEVEIGLTEAIPDEIEVEDLPCWAEERAAELVERVVRMLDRQCADEQQDEAERVEQRLRAQIRDARALLAANAREDGDPIATYLAAKRRRDAADAAGDEDARMEAQDAMDEAASLLALHGIAVDPDAMEQGGVHLDGGTGRLAAWDWDPRTIDPETGWSIDVIEVGEDDTTQEQARAW